MKDALYARSLSLVCCVATLQRNVGFAWLLMLAENADCYVSSGGCSSSHRCIPVGMIPKVGLFLFSLAIISTVTIHFGKALWAPITHFTMCRHVTLMTTGVRSYTFNCHRGHPGPQMDAFEYPQQAKKHVRTDMQEGLHSLAIEQRCMSKE